ncbi:MAG: hypothetical protein R6T91_06060 [Bacteroidales bacterium]
MNIQQIRYGLKMLGQYLEVAASAGYNTLNEKQKQQTLRLEAIIEQAGEENHWFSENNTRYAYLAMAQMLKQAEELTTYPDKVNHEVIGIVPPAIAPLDGLKDIAITLAAGYKVQLKQMFAKEKLLPEVINALYEINPDFKTRISLQPENLKDFDKLIVTVPSSHHEQWDKYFSRYSGKIRRPRYAAAIVTGKETLNQMEALGNDIFRYFGKTFNNVTKLYIPKNYNLKLFKEAFEPFQQELNYHTAYFNNYEYNKSIYLINQEATTDFGYVLFKEDALLPSRIGVIHIQRYQNQAALEQMIQADQAMLSHLVCIDSIQNHTTISPGKVHIPDFSDHEALHTLKQIIA